MNLKEIITELNIGFHQISLKLQGQMPIAEYKNQTFSHLWGLVDIFPELSDLQYIGQFAILSNFFWKAGQFQFIDAVGDYQDFYLERVELEKLHPQDQYEYRLTDFKIFDISVMHPPKVENNQLVYFTFNLVNRLPYRVVCPFPYPKTSTYVYYQILPILEPV
jgi:hypothetical protein